MAGFLRKKTKQEKGGPPAISSPVTLASSVPPPPLFARFASTAHSNDSQTSQRLVSPPMSLAAQQRQREAQGKGIGGRHGSSTSSLAAGSRDVDIARRMAQEQAMAPAATSRNGSYDQSARSPPPASGIPTHLRQRPGEQAVPRPLSRVIVDKPLPLPTDDGPISTGNRQPTANRGPPPSFQHPQQGTGNRASLDAQNRNSKPLPRPESAQSFYPPSASYNFSPPPSSPRKRAISNTTAGNTSSPTNFSRKTQPVPSSYGQKPLPSPADQTLSPRLSKAQDLPSDSVYGNGFGHVAPSSVPVAQPQPYHGTPSSDRGVDLPQEFALFQDYSETISIPSQPNSLNSRRPLPPPAANGGPTKPTEQLAASSASRSSILHEGQNYPPHLSVSQAAAAVSPRARPSPPLPLPPAPTPPPDMGVATSHVLPRPDVLPSPTYKDLYPAHVLTSMNGGNATYNSNISDPDQHHQQQQSPPVIHNRSNSRSTSPPLPPGAAHPTTFQSFNNHQPHETYYGGARPQKRKPPTAQRSLPPPGVSTQPQDSMHLEPGSLRKSPSVQVGTAPMRGKPKIFAAMEGQDAEPEPERVNGVGNASAGIPQASHLSPLQPPHHILPSQPPVQPGQRRNPPLAKQHARQASLTTAEEFMTPKSQFEGLPDELSNGDAFGSGAGDTQPPIVKSPPTVVEQLPIQQQQPITTRTPRPKSRPLPNPDPRQQQQQQLLSPQSPPRQRKLSKTRPDDASSIHTHNTNGSTPSTTTHGRARSSSKVRPTTPLSPPHHLLSPSPVIPVLAPSPAPLEPSIQLDDNTIMNAGIPLDDDPFARFEGVKMLKPSTPPLPKDAVAGSPAKRSRTKSSSKEHSSSLEGGSNEGEASQTAEPQKQNGAATPLTPVSPEEYKQTRKERRGKDKTQPPPTVESVIVQQQEDRPPPEPITMAQLLSESQVLVCLLEFMSFYEWCVLLGLTKEIRILLVRTPSLREAVLERFLKTVGYSRWIWDEQEPLSLSLQDLGDYMRGVSTPTHEYARVAAMYVHSLTIHPTHRDPSLGETVQGLTASTRAYTRVLLRLRAQAEKEASLQPPGQSATPPTANKAFNFSPGRGGNASRMSSRAPSPTTSNYSHSHSQVNIPGAMQAAASQSSLSFRSPLFRLRRAPLLRVFVPSPEGDWLSDRSVLECEAECKRAGVSHMMRHGDVVWDVAVGDEGNVGRLVWDGSYLIDLDYTYSAMGDLPKYMPTLAFAPSYFHRVIRTGPSASNPIVHIDLSPWGEEIALNLQLLQDRVRTETPQGAYHNVMRWVHRSSFSLRPPRGPQRYNHSGKAIPASTRIPIPGSDRLFVDPGWYGTIVVETEGTNEALADLQDRCGPGAFPPRPRGVNGHVSQAQIENRKVFRILREKSRPGEIWIRTVSVKERLL